MAVIDTANSVTLSGVLSNRTSTQIGSLIKIGSGTLILNASNTYTGGTAVNAGILVVGSATGLSTNSAVTVSNGATLKFNQASTVGPLTVAGTLEQGLVTITSLTDVVFSDDATLKVNGTPTSESYTLVEGSSVTGTPTLIGADGYELRVDSTSVKLVKSGSTFGSIYPPGSEETVGSNGLQNLMNYALGGTGPSSSPALPVLTSDGNAIMLTANIRNDDSSLNLPGKVVGQWAESLEGDWIDIPASAVIGVTSSVDKTTVKRITVLIEEGKPRKFLRFKVSK
jgi:autotransporter-associated beta strand protein